MLLPQGNVFVLCALKSFTFLIKMGNHLYILSIPFAFSASGFNHKNVSEPLRHVASKKA